MTVIVFYLMESRGLYFSSSWNFCSFWTVVYHVVTDEQIVTYCVWIWYSRQFEIAYSRRVLNFPGYQNIVQSFTYKMSQKDLICTKLERIYGIFYLMKHIMPLECVNFIANCFVLLCDLIRDNKGNRFDILTNIWDETKCTYEFVFARKLIDQTILSTM